MTEYWLQKKTLSGWSLITYYTTEAEAIKNMENAAKSNNGYSWRVMKAEQISERLLEEVTAVKAPDIQPDAKANVWAGNKTTSNGWGDTAVTSKPNGWGNHDVSFIKPVEKSEHGMTGKVWMIHHTKHLRARVPEASIVQYQADGYEFGGPKMGFRG